MKNQLRIKMNMKYHKAKPGIPTRSFPDGRSREGYEHGYRKEKNAIKLMIKN